MESFDSARWCFRYNLVTNMALSWHGTNSGGKSSTLQVESYENTFTFTNLGTEAAYTMLCRGGTAVIWSNTVIQTTPNQVGSFAQFWVECASTNLEPTLPNWEVEYCPAQLFYPTNYVSPQQVGEGSSTNGAGESLWPVYMWGNSTPANGGYIYLGHDGGDSPFIQQGRDVFTNSIMPGYAPLVYPSPLAGGALTATALGSQVAGAALRNVIFH